MNLPHHFTLKDGKLCVVRRATPNDAEDLLGLVRSVAAEKIYLRSERIDWSVEEERAWIQGFNGRTGVLLVTTVGGRLIASADLRRGRNAKDNHVADLGVAVRRGFRRLGIGKALLARGMEWARSARLRKITLEVFDSNVGARALYHALGFAEEGRQKLQVVVRGQPTDTIHMSLWLDPFPSRGRVGKGASSAVAPGKELPLIVIVRGPMGSGKTTLMRGLARDSPYRLWALDADAATEGHPSDPYGEHLATEWSIELEILALHSRIVLGRGINLVIDSGELLHKSNVDRFLRLMGRSRRDPRVVLFRLAVSPEIAVRRKTTVKPANVRASHQGWQPSPVPGEIVIDVDHLTAREVLGVALRALRARVGRRSPGTPVRVRRVPRRRTSGS